MRKKFVVGMIHLPKLVGQDGFLGMDAIKKKVLRDLRRYEEGGVDAVLVENWEDSTSGPFLDDSHYDCMDEVLGCVLGESGIPVGVNVLPNDYCSAFKLAVKYGLDFIQLDVFMDHVVTDYSYSNQEPFEVRVDVDHFRRVREEVGAVGVPVYVNIIPKHYKMLEEKTIVEAARQAFDNGADGVVVTGVSTGCSPVLDDLKLVREFFGDKIIIVGSGTTKDNVGSFLEYADGVIVGTAFKDDDFCEVLPQRVEAFMSQARGCCV